MEKLLNKKVCIVTGAARGIGKAIVERFAKDGAIVYAVDICVDSMEDWIAAFVQKHGVVIHSIYVDIAEQQLVKNILMDIYKREGRIDCVVNNAAIISNQKLGMIARENIERMYRVNVFALIDIIQIVSRLMARTGGGSIINIASITGIVGSPGQVAYSSTKGAVVSITKSAAKELAPTKIRVNAVAPGIIETERFEELYLEGGGKIDERINKIGLGRLGTPQDVANACSFLASERASYISGQIIGIDGCATI